MTLTLKPRYTGKPTFKATIEAYVENEIMSCLSSGALEDMERKTRNAACAIGRLLDTLAERGVISLKDIVEIVGDSDEVVET